MEFGKSGSVSSILNDSKLNVGGVFLPELSVLVIRDLLDHIQSLTNKFLLDNLEQFVLLKGLSRDIQWKIIRVDNTLDKTEIVGHHVLEIVSDEDTSDIELDILCC